MNVSQLACSVPDNLDSDIDIDPPPLSNLGKRSRDLTAAVSNSQTLSFPHGDSRNNILKAPSSPAGLADFADASSCGSNSSKEQASSISGRSKAVHEYQASPNSIRNPRQSPTTAQQPNLRSTSGQPPLKKRRRRTRARYRIEPLTSFGRFSGESMPPSPSLFSDHTIQRPSLPIRLSGSKGGAAMLGKLKKEDNGGIRTLRMARGSINVGSPSSASDTTNSIRSRRSRSPDELENVAGHLILNQVGVVEILEQDERPTFIIDLANRANFEPGYLRVVYANMSLRAMDGLLDQVTGRFNDDLLGLASVAAFNEFKAWSTSYVRNHEPLDVTLPSFFYGGVTWTCCSLKKRLRLIRGESSLGNVNLGSNAPSIGFPTSSVISRNQMNTKSGSTEVLPEPSDYFSNAYAPRLVGTRSTGPEDDCLSSNGSPGSPGRAVHSKYKNSDSGERHAYPIREKPEAGSTLVSPFRSHPDEAILGTTGEVRSNDFSIFPEIHQGFFDWTRLPNTPALPAHIRFARSVDWASGPLGPIEGWSPELRTMCNLLMASPHPAAMYWGEELIIIYNEAYILLAGQKHPRIMGQRYSEAWPEIWQEMRPVFDSVRSTGQSIMKDDDCLFIKRSASSGFLEETYFSWSLIPLVGANGSVVGLHNPAFEKTRQKITERRMLTLREVGEKIAVAQDLKSFWSQLLKGLEFNEPDTPFVLLYSVADDTDSDTSSMQSNTNLGPTICVLEGSLGFPRSHQATPPRINLKEESSGYLGNLFKEVAKMGKPVLLQTDDGTFDPNLLEAVEPRGYDDFCKAAVCCPIHIPMGDSVLGFLLMGVNPRRPYDDDYDLFIQLLNRQLAASMASCVLFEEEIAKGRRAARLAAIDRIQLAEQLAARTEEAVESEKKFAQMAEFAPVGIFIADFRGHITYCNDTWYEISGVPREHITEDKWMDYIMDEDRAVVKAMWNNLVSDAAALNVEFRYRTPWQDPNGIKGDTWVLASAYPEKNHDGTLKGIFGSITNISQQKWAEYFEKRRVEEAVEMKRQQENFIDITSHEMRNPLSAMLQCADEISTSLTGLKSESKGFQKLSNNVIENSIDAAQTIALCAQHQKRIVDDILTLSKLDSALLLVTPCDVLPISVAKRALKIFDSEVQKADIRLDFKVDQSVDRLNVDWVKLDPSRLLQVLINLTTNAIKFTTTQKKRIIRLTYGVSLERPSSESFNRVSYFPTRAKRKDPTEGIEWGTGEKVFLYFAMQDTGRGLTEDETKLLFHRFSQASPRTHVQYGGSGLGLFISRELVELQGGEIGVSSKAGEGSIFAFYIKARKSKASSDMTNDLSAASPATSSMDKLTVPLLGTPSSPDTIPAEIIPKDDLKILIVEDNLVNQRVLQKQLRNLGCTVHIANHGEECLNQLKESTFWNGREADGKCITVVLMDLEMPVMDGLTCVQKIRELESAGAIVRHVPIIAVSANARSEQIDTALEAGMVSSLFFIQIQ